MQPFHTLKSVARLRELAESPIDLSEEGQLCPKRIEQMQSAALGLKLLYATERVTEPTMHALCDLAQETKAVESMHAMQAGVHMNCIDGYPSENRPVLHTAMRDFFDHPSTGEPALKATALAYQELEKLKNFLQKIEHEGRFTTLIQIGIGGSALGPEAIYLGLQAYQKPGRSIHFWSNIDPDEGTRIMRCVDLSKTLIVVVSKSGTTLETAMNEARARKILIDHELDPKEHLVAVTGKASPMDDPTRYLASFYIWDYIGGRYSVTSMVGGVALAFMLGMERFLEFLRGASAMDKIALKQDPKANLPLLGALLGVWNRNFLDLPTCAIIPYTQALSRFPAHLQQLDMESNGKRIDKQGAFVQFDTGPVIWGEVGTNSQHSFFQLIHQGTEVIPLEFIAFAESQHREDFLFEGTSLQDKLLSNVCAQSIALAVGQKSANPNQSFPGNRPTRLLLAPRLDPYTMGMLLAYYEHLVAFQGFMWNINSFDQEGVQLGKKLATQMIRQHALKREGKSGDFPLGAAYMKFLEKETV